MKTIKELNQDYEYLEEQEREIWKDLSELKQEVCEKIYFITKKK